MSVTEDLQDTLAMVNIARQAFGKDMLTELPDSRPGASADCLFYRALADIGVSSVGGDGSMACQDERQAAYIAHLWGTSANGNKVHAPRQFGRTIERFDTKKLPHYDSSAPKHF